MSGDSGAWECQLALTESRESSCEHEAENLIPGAEHHSGGSAGEDPVATTECVTSSPVPAEARPL